MVGLTQGRGKTPHAESQELRSFGERFLLVAKSYERGSAALIPDADAKCIPEELATVYFVVVCKYSGTPRCLGQYPTRQLAIGWYDHSMWCKVLSQLCTIYHTESFYIYFMYLNITFYTIFLLTFSPLRHKDKTNTSPLIPLPYVLQQERKIGNHSLKSLLRQTV